MMAGAPFVLIDPSSACFFSPRNVDVVRSHGELEGAGERFTRRPDKAHMYMKWFLSLRQILWTLTFAAQLILLVVLLGRDRVRRYPWFTAGIGLFALRLMAEMLLAGRMAMLPLQIVLLTLADLATLAGLLVVVEVARRAFAEVKRSQLIAYIAGVLVVALGVLSVWGPWPAWANLGLDSLLGRLRVMQLAAQKGDELIAVLAVEVGLLVVLFGRRFKAGWRSHTQMIAIGLSTVAVAMLATQAAVQSIVRTAQPQTREEYTHVLALLGNLVNANKVVYLATLVWWIVWLWLDEPGAAKEIQAAEPAEETPTEAVSLMNEGEH
jgi:hypothetical protein